jgi:hypothetical protein
MTRIPRRRLAEGLRRFAGEIALVDEVDATPVLEAIVRVRRPRGNFLSCVGSRV